MTDRSSMTEWFPKISEIGLPTPKTVMVQMGEEARRDIYRVFDGERMTGAAELVFDAIRSAGTLVGYPCFLRTAHTSGKHDWENTCYVARPEQVGQHVINIVEYGELSCLQGLPFDWWAVRELLPTEAIAVCQRWGKMPVCREFRVFVEDDVVKCWHPYWPLEALEQGGVANPGAAFEELRGCSALDINTFLDLARRAGKACGGAWSVDVLETARGWFVTDMAVASNSFHWEGCPNA